MPLQLSLDRPGKEAERRQDLPEAVVQLPGEVGPLVGLGVENANLRPPHVVGAADAGAHPDHRGVVLQQVDGHRVDRPPRAVVVPEPQRGQLHRNPGLEVEIKLVPAAQEAPH